MYCLVGIGERRLETPKRICSTSSVMTCRCRRTNERTRTPSVPAIHVLTVCLCLPFVVRYLCRLPVFPLRNVCLSFFTFRSSLLFVYATKLFFIKSCIFLLLLRALKERYNNKSWQDEIGTGHGAPERGLDLKRPDILSIRHDRGLYGTLSGRLDCC